MKWDTANFVRRNGIRQNGMTPVKTYTGVNITLWW